MRSFRCLLPVLVLCWVPLGPSHPQFLYASASCSPLCSFQALPDSGGEQDGDIPPGDSHRCEKLSESLPALPPSTGKPRRGPAPRLPRERRSGYT